MTIQLMIPIILAISILSPSISYSSEDNNIEVIEPAWWNCNADLYNQQFIDDEISHFNDKIRKSRIQGVRFLYNLIHPKNADPSKGRFLIYWKGNGAMRGSASTAETRHKNKAFGGRTDAGHVGMITPLKSLDCVKNPNDKVENQNTVNVLADIDRILGNNGAIQLKVIEVESSQLERINREITAAKVAIEHGLNYQILCKEYRTWKIEGYNFDEEFDPLSIEHVTLAHGNETAGNCASMIYTALSSLSLTMPSYLSTWSPVVTPYQVYDFTCAPLDVVKKAREIYSNDDIKNMYNSMKYGTLYKISASHENTKNNEVAKNLIDSSLKTKWLAPVKSEVIISLNNNKDQSRKSKDKNLLFSTSRNIEPTITFEYYSTQKFFLKGYTLTSGNDYPERDPYEWSVEGSNDGKKWSKIERRSSYKFKNRLQTLKFEVNKQSKKYSMFRFTVHKILGEAKSTQLTGLELDLETE